MALPSASIGYYDFGNQYRAGAELAQGSRQIANQMVNLGASISASLTENNQRKEAQALAPQLAATYQQGFTDIFNGNPSGGLSTIYGASAQASTNPFLARMAESATTAANWATNNFMKQQMQVNSINAQSQLAQDRNDEYNRRFGMQNEEYDRRYGMRQDTAENKPLTPSQKFDASIKVQKESDRLFKILNETSDETEYTNALTGLNNVLSAAGKIGEAADLPEVFRAATPEQRDELKAHLSNLRDLQTKINAGETESGGFLGWGKTDNKKRLAEIQKEVDAIHKTAQEALKLEKPDEATPIEGELPLSPSTGEDTIPLTGELQGTDAQKAMQAEELEQAAILQQVQSGQLTREQAIEIARQRGWN